MRTKWFLSALAFLLAIPVFAEEKEKKETDRVEESAVVGTDAVEEEVAVASDVARVPAWRPSSVLARLIGVTT